MDNSYFIAFCVIVLLVFVFLIYMNGGFLRNKSLNTEETILEQNGTLEVPTNIETVKVEK
jgi:heme/copper-type cytochrome/quinol oxidase subunit 2